MRTISQAVIEKEFDTAALTGRLLIMMNKIQEIHKNEERFIIVADRIFLMLLAVYVFSILTDLIIRYASKNLIFA